MRYFSKFKIKNRALPAQAGFTLIELIVVMAIAAIIMTSLVIQQSKWNDQLSVSTQAYELVLMIRQAQIYSLGVREDVSGTGDKFDKGYGVHFDSNFSRYIYFADRNKNLKYDSGEGVETKTFTRGVTIEKICGLRSGSESCVSPLDSIDISFFRPDPKANLSFLNGGGNPAPGFGSPATLYLKSSGDKKYKVTVYSNGQVSIAPI